MKPSLLLFFLVFGMGLVLGPHIGVSWDEPDNIYSGGVYWNFFQKKDPTILTDHEKPASLFGDRISSQNTDLSHYPPLPNYIGTLLVMVSGQFGYGSDAAAIIDSFHWASSIFFAILVATVFRFGKFLGLSYSASLFAALTTFFYPTIFGYGFSNLKDTAQAAMFAVSLLTLVRGKIFLGAVLWGFALATKFNAIYVPIIWGIRKIGGIRDKFLVLGVGFATVFLVWPYLWSHPVGRALEVVRYFTTVGKGYGFWWNGSLYHSGVGASLWWYPWGYLLVSTPILLLILGVIGAIRAIWEWKKYGILLIWLAIPSLRAFLPNAAFYDGLRHFMEVLPALILLAGIGVEELGRLGRLWKLGIMGGIVAHLAFINMTLFPYSSGYYNVLAKNANENFDRDIEALSIKESMDYLHQTYGTTRVWAPIGGHLAWYLVRSGDRYVYTPQAADSIIFVNKSSHGRRNEFEKTLPSDFHLDYVVRRADAIFAWIYRRTSYGKR